MQFKFRHFWVSLAEIVTKQLDFIVPFGMTTPGKIAILSAHWKKYSKNYQQ